MLKIASASGAPSQTPLEEHTTLPQTPSREGLLAFGNCSFEPSALSCNLTCSHVLIGTLVSRSQFSPLQALLLNSWIRPSYMRFVELTNYGYFCILCPNPIYFYGPSVIS